MKGMDRDEFANRSDVLEPETFRQDGAVPEPAITVREPAHQTAPIIVTSPHSGSEYAPRFLAASRLDPRSLRKSEDCFVDELFGFAPAVGLPLLAARFPRAYCDVNREAWELDPAMFEDMLPPHVNHASPRVAAGLGTIARVVAFGEPLYRHKLRFAEAERRIERCWKPYHAALVRLIAKTKERFGACIVLDCHSMPSTHSGLSESEPDFVLGDAHGAACGRAIVALIEMNLRGEGFIVRRNDPYAGGYVTRHYGRPREHVHVLQIEVARKLYMDEANLVPTQGFIRMQAVLTTLLQTIITMAPHLI